MDFIITPDTALVIGAIVAPIFFIGSVWITRATGKRIIGAIAASAAFSLANAVWDQLAFRAGLWSYPAFGDSPKIIFLYIAAGIVSGGAFGLVGWRLIRRYNVKGLIVFITLWSIWGVIHDFGGGALFASSNLIHFENGMIPVAADALLYASCGALAQAVIRIIGGPSKSDPLRK